MKLDLETFYTVHVEEVILEIDWEVYDCSPVTIQFSDLTASASEWFWQFGDGDTSHLQNPNHEYDSTLDYLVSLTTMSGAGCMVTTLLPVNGGICSGEGGTGSDSIPGGGLSGAMVVDYNTTYPNMINCAPSLLHFASPFPDHDSWNWQFGDSTSSSAQVPTHVYTNPGVYNVLHTAVDSSGNIDSLWVNNIIVLGTGQADFVCISNYACSAPVVNYTSLNPAIYNHYWDFGDGGVDSIPNPSHNFSVGNYLLYSALTISDTSGCESTRMMPILIEAQEFFFNYDSLVLHWR